MDITAYIHYPSTSISSIFLWWKLVYLFGSLIHYSLMLLLLIETSKPSAAVDECLGVPFPVLDIVLDIFGVSIISFLAKFL